MIKRSDDDHYGRPKELTNGGRPIKMTNCFTIVKGDLRFPSADTVTKAWDVAIDTWKGVPTSNRPYFRAQAMNAMRAQGFKLEEAPVGLNENIGSTTWALPSSTVGELDK